MLKFIRLRQVRTYGHILSQLFRKVNKTFLQRLVRCSISKTSLELRSFLSINLFLLVLRGSGHVNVFLY